jgi:hypothetical protein
MPNLEAENFPWVVSSVLLAKSPFTPLLPVEKMTRLPVEDGIEYMPTLEKSEGMDIWR